jgi:hypothetical protein
MRVSVKEKGECCDLGLGPLSDDKVHHIQGHAEQQLPKSVGQLIVSSTLMMICEARDSLTNNPC